MKAIYAGSFDPVTNGHIDIIRRARNIFGEVTVAVLNNVKKQGLFTVEERMELLEEVTKDLDGVTIDSFTGLLADYAKEKDCKVIIRGIRTASDYESEYILAMANMHYYEGLETVFLLSSNKNTFVSSTLAKEVAMFDGDLSLFVPDVVGDAMKEKLIGR